MTQQSFFLSACLLAAGSLAQAQSAYIYKVYDYAPAPGQFVNELPKYQQGDSRADMIRKAEEAIGNNNQGMISLGGYGGYVVFGFDHLVENLPGRYDFKVLGNAFVAEANPNSDAPGDGGSCEPGVVMVAYDANGNGLPDDPWYELAGSEYRRPTTVRDYRITYHKPDPLHTPVPHPTDQPVNDIEYIRWTTNGHGSGYVHRNIYHNQSYYPLWIDDETYELRGSRLADNAVDESGRGNYWVQYAKHWGYVDNYPNADSRSGMNIEWAVDASGNPANLPGVHFVKVYNAINQNCGWLGESSTEILGAEDLHLTGKDYAVPVFAESVSLNRSSASLSIGETLALYATVAPGNAANKGVVWKSFSPAVAEVDAQGAVTAIAEGAAVIRARTIDGYYIATCTITVQHASSPQVHVTGVHLDRSTLRLDAGLFATLTATVEPADAANKAVHWSSSNDAVAEVTVNGLVVGVSNGTATVSARTDDGGYIATCLVTVGVGSATETPAADQPQAWYSDGSLHLRNLGGYRCTVMTIGGQRVGEFTVGSAASAFLQRGVYLLDGRKGGKRVVLKFFVR